jgi:pilus assembly protein CpaE
MDAVPSRNGPTVPTLEQRTGRHDRPPLIAFISDAASEKALREGLADAVSAGLDVRRGGIRAAITAMQKMVTPRVLVVDVSGEDQPLSALADLSGVVEPDVCVLVVGDSDSVDFYREVTRGLGADEYLPKPLTNDKVARNFGVLLAGRAPAAESVQGGRTVAITGVCGGVGATTLAANLAWHFGVSMRRHTLLLDTDLFLGDVSFLLNLKPGPGLRAALEAPDRIDALLAERAAQPAAERLHVLAGEEPLTARLNYAPDAVDVLLAALRARYNFIVADAPFSQAVMYRDILKLAQQQVLVMTPTLASVRATLRLLSFPMATTETARPVIVLNRVGSTGSLTRRQVEDALAVKVDVAIPDMPRQVGAAATMGEMAVAGRGGFRDGVLELAGRVAFVRLLDSTAGATPSRSGERARSRWPIFGRS